MRLLWTPLCSANKSELGSPSPAANQQQRARPRSRLNKSPLYDFESRRQLASTGMMLRFFFDLVALVIEEHDVLSSDRAQPRKSQELFGFPSCDSRPSGLIFSVNNSQDSVILLSGEQQGMATMLSAARNSTSHRPGSVIPDLNSDPTHEKGNWTVPETLISISFCCLNPTL